MPISVIDGPSVAYPSKELLDFANRQMLATKLQGGIDKRSDKRELIVVTVLVQPVDDECQPIESPFRVVTRDLSPTAVGLVHLDAILHDKLALQMCIANTVVNIFGRVVRCEPLGPSYGTGVEFIAKLDAFPTRGGLTSLKRRRTAYHTAHKLRRNGNSKSVLIDERTPLRDLPYTRGPNRM